MFSSLEVGGNCEVQEMKFQQSWNMKYEEGEKSLEERKPQMSQNCAVQHGSLWPLMAVEHMQCGWLVLLKN